MTGTVLEEGLRGAGGHLLNGAMHRFMGDYDPKLERATRDVVSRAIYAEMRAGRTTPHGGVYIKMGHLGPASVAKQFKGMVDRCRDCGFDLAGGLVEVVPTAHYFMGGVICAVDTATERFGLFVAGEDASGMHGANRLGGNGVANSTVFGGIAGDVMPGFIAKNPGHRPPDTAVLDAEVERALHPFQPQAGRSQCACARSCWIRCGMRSAWSATAPASSAALPASTPSKPSFWPPALPMSAASSI